MKKLISIFALIALTFSLMAGCSSNTATSSQSPAASDTPATAASDTASQSPEAAASPSDEATPAASTELMISAASSLTDVMGELQTLYAESNPNVTLTFTFDSSGNLQTQIEEGSPTDVFISAAKKQITALSDGGLLNDDSVKTIVSNELVLIVPSDSTLAISSFEDLAGDAVSKLAIGDPASVPAGKYADEVFTSLGISDKVTSKEVLGSNVRQVLTWVETGEAEAGVVFATDALTSDAVKVICDAPEGSHTDIIYPAAVIKSSKNADAALAFLDFLSTDAAKAVFEKYGFIV